MFDTPERLAFGLLTGLLFGFLLQKGQVTKFRTIVGQFLLKDFTVLKVMLTAVVVGGIGVAVLVGAGQAAFHIKPLVLGGIVAGGLLFGVGMAVLGYCPGTGVAAIAEGSRHAIYGVLGMLFGAAVYAEVYPAIKATVLTWGDYGKQTLPAATGTSHAIWLAAIGLGAASLFITLEWFERRRQSTAHDTTVNADQATA